MMKIRQLEWKEENGNYVAEAFGGWYETFRGVNGIGVFWSFNETVRTIDPRRFNHIEGAKHVCQLDFEILAIECLEEDSAHFELSHQRYEKLRRLNVPQFAEIFRRNIEGEKSFDELVDELS
jgi:hypothetical protein